jgi:EF-P beta-lysylation protein EpmB
MNLPSSQLQLTSSWQHDITQGVRKVSELLNLLHISPDKLPDTIDHDSDFPFRVPRSYVERMNKGDPQDPLLRQVLPITREQEKTPGFSSDPVGDLPAMSARGLVHKYQGRVLLITTGACAVHCRYCFRRHFPYSETQLAMNDWDNAINYIANDTSITEVILSGGDPLTLSDRRLSSLTDKLCEIPHLNRLRIHTRLPVVLPARVDSGLLDWLKSIPLRTVMVIHANHPNEINSEVQGTLVRLVENGMTLLNQSVLLRGVNNDSTILVQLSEILFAAGVIPYYLHVLDKVQGAAHFAVEDEKIRFIYQELLSSLPGYLVPRLVRENAGEHYKMPITSYAR